MEILNRQLTETEKNYIKRHTQSSFSYLSLAYWSACLFCYFLLLLLLENRLKLTGFLVFSAAFLLLCIIIKRNLLHKLRIHKHEELLGYLYRLSGKISCDGNFCSVDNKEIILPTPYITNKLIKDGDEVIVDAYNNYPPDLEPGENFIALKINNKLSIEDDYYLGLGTKKRPFLIGITVLLGFVLPITATIMDAVMINEWQVDKKTQIREHCSVFFANMGQDKMHYKTLTDFKSCPPQKWQAFSLDSIYLFPIEYEGKAFVIIENRTKLDSILTQVSKQLHYISGREDSKKSGKQELTEILQTGLDVYQPEEIKQVIELFNKIYSSERKSLIQLSYLNRDYYKKLKVFMNEVTSYHSIEGYNIDIDFGKSIVFNRVKLNNREFDELLWLLLLNFIAIICAFSLVNRIINVRKTNKVLKRKYMPTNN